MTKTNFEDAHRFQLFLGQICMFPQFLKIMLRIVAIDKFWIAQLSCFPQNPLSCEIPSIALVDASVPTVPVPRDGVPAVATLNRNVQSSWEVSKFRPAGRTLH